LREVPGPRAIRRLTRIFMLQDGPRWARCEPAEAPVLEVAIDFPHPLARRRSMSLASTPETFMGEIAWARTFSLEPEARILKARGLARGGSLDNAVVLAEGGGVLNPGGLRGPDEPLRHKVLDLIGDLALVGTPLVARVVAEHPGHAFNLALARALVAASEPPCPC
jgi:UDP-3-O-[3-hydroxymyristoyl] N-acetylglucosamine deacetylase